jgi:hypothetical protein
MMATSITKTDVFNRALAEIGTRLVTSDTEDSHEANTCNALYDMVRLELNQSHAWNWAIRRTELAQETSDPTWKWDNSFALPADMLKLLKVSRDEYDHQFEPRYQVKGKQGTTTGVINTDEDKIFIEYVADVQEVIAMPPLYREALAYKLAMVIAVPLTEQRSKADAAERKYNAAVMKAKSQDAQSDHPPVIPDTSWLLSRNRGIVSGWPSNKGQV